jgi:hypothetical protein
MKASDWISVKDRLPKLGKDVLVCIVIDDGIDIFQVIGKGYLDKYKNPHYPIGVWCINNEGIYTDSISHWQYIVLPKKEKL